MLYEGRGGCPPKKGKGRGLATNLTEEGGAVTFLMTIIDGMKKDKKKKGTFLYSSFGGHFLVSLIGYGHETKKGRERRAVCIN